MHSHGFVVTQQRQEQDWKQTGVLVFAKYSLISGSEILAELAESRACYQAGEGEDFDKVLDEIGGGKQTGIE